MKGILSNLFSKEQWRFAQRVSTDEQTRKRILDAHTLFRARRTCDLWQWHPHALLVHRPCPPVAHSITLVALFSNTWTCEYSGSLGRSAAGLADLTEKSVPATLADALADRELDSHDRVLD